MVCYKLIMITINTLSFVEVIIVIIMRHYNFPNLIVTNWGLLFTSKFWLLLYYFLSIKQRLSNTFYLQINGLTKRQNSTIRVYFQAFVNFEQNNWIRFLLMARFAYNNTKNASIKYILFEHNCRYHPCVFYEENFDFYSKSKTTQKLSFKL